MCKGTRSAVFVAVFFLAAVPAWAGWDPVTGVKDGSDTVTEPQNPWVGGRLWAFGGVLNFAGDVQLNGELWLQQMNGWGNPTVNIAGALTMIAPISDFRVLDGAILSVGNAAGSSVEAGNVVINNAAQVTIGSMAAHGHVRVGDHAPGSMLHVLGNHVQDGNDHFLLFNNSQFVVDGTFTKTGTGDFQVSDSIFQLGNAAGSSVEAGGVTIDSGAQVTVGQMAAHGNATIGGHVVGTLLHVLGNYEQDAGSYRQDVGSSVSVGGAFEYATDGPVNLFISSTSVLQVGESLRLSNGNVLNVEGVINIGAGPMPTAGVLRLGLGGTLAGSGTLVGQVLVDAGGTVIPGASPGNLRVTGTYVQFPNGVISVEIGGTLPEVEYDQVLVTGSANLAGTLSVGLVDMGSGTFQPQLGQAFDILMAGNVTGTFTDYAFPALAVNLTWDVQYLADRVALLVESPAISTAISAATWSIWMPLRWPLQPVVRPHST